MTVHVAKPTAPQFLQPLTYWRMQYPAIAALIDAGAPPAKALRHLGLQLWGDKRLDEAADAFAEATALAPDEPQAFAEYGSVLSALGRHKEALSALAASLRLHSRQAQVWLTLAGAANALGDKMIAEKAFRAALEISPDAPEALAGLGLLCIEARRFEEAAHLLGAAVARGAAAAAVHACLGQTLHHLGRFGEASRAFEQAARAAPREPRIIRKYAEARFLEATIVGDIGAALALYRALAGPFAEDLATFGRPAFQALSAYGEPAAAIRLARAMLEILPGDPALLYHLDALTERRLSRAPDAYLTACFDRYAPTFDDHLVRVLDYRIPEKCAAMLGESGGAFKTILDLGCGTGLAAPHLARFGAQLTGVDISAGMLDKAKARGLYAKLIESEAIAYLHSGGEMFDLVVALDVLVYFGDLETLFAGVATRLAPGGVFAFSYETGAEPFRLQPSGRFVHRPAYIDQLARRHYSPLADLPTTLRLEANRPVEGHLALLRRNANDGCAPG